MTLPPYPKIAVIAAYFGPLPNYFDLWALSAGRNSFIDFLLVTDADPRSLTILPNNIRTICMTLDAFRQKAEAQLGTKIALTRAYKICDLRPAFAKIFETELQAYAYWGYCDLDIIWGDLQCFLPQDVFSKFDRIQERGHLTFLRNTDAIRNLVFAPENWTNYKSVLADPRSYIFDEYGGYHSIVYQAGLSRSWSKAYADIAFDRFHLSVVSTKNYRHQIFYWEDGKVIREHLPEKANNDFEIAPECIKTEFAYLHLQKRKMKAHALNAASVRGFYITPDSFLPKRAYDHSVADYYKFNPRKLKKTYLIRRIKSVIAVALYRLNLLWSRIAVNFNDRGNSLSD